ncbi:MAG: glucosidase [Chitinophagaceae bacterium]|jgi:hypothetical protein|nr:glucosidase [Chitinophagaceae bacterium]
MNKEQERLKVSAWKKWGPYLSNRQWGTVREDYSANGQPWEYTTYDMAMSKTWRWGEEGIAGISDDKQILCFAPAFWNTKDTHIKERFFGLNNTEGNHGEDVKELFYYLDSSPTHSYMKMLYKYPQNAFPYERLRLENARRTKAEPEFELIDTGIFNNNEYFDIFIEYAKASEEDILIKITACNRNTQAAPLHILPQIWFRNRWSWGYHNDILSIQPLAGNAAGIRHSAFDNYFLYSENNPQWLVCNNETNTEKLYNAPSNSKYFKDGINEYIVNGNTSAVLLSDGDGTKAAANYFFQIAGNSSATVKLRLTKEKNNHPFTDFDSIFSERITETDAFYSELQTNIFSDDEKQIHRQALAGLLWNKQFYDYNVLKWLTGDPTQPPPPPEHRVSRNFQWTHVNCADVISMPDKWEFPWFAAWDLAFHCISLALIDAGFAKNQLLLLTREWYMHPNGQLPAYEWSFEDANPPVHAWAAWEVYRIDAAQNNGNGDIAFLESVFQKLLLNFTWWVNRKDANGYNIFSGGFLGLDNVGVFDRSMKLPEGVTIEQADGTSWMAMYALNMMNISLELATHNAVYEDMATKFFEHFMYIAGAIMNVIGCTDTGLWDNDDEFFYDELNIDGHHTIKMKLRSIVGLIPMFAVEIIDDDRIKQLPGFAARMHWFLENKKDLTSLVSRWSEKGSGDKHLLSLLRGHRMKRLLYRMLSESEFLSDYGVRSLSKIYSETPYTFCNNGETLTVKYTPGESADNTFGGNSNWRGPVWMPVNYLIIISLLRFHRYYSDDFKVEYPTGSSKYLSLKEIARELSQRLINLFKRNADGVRPCMGNNEQLQKDEHFKDYILFNEYFHGDSGKGLGASHQTGWTALIVNLLQREW